jgi:glycosyltransferase involved in cell wall biosynthesis
VVTFHGTYKGFRDMARGMRSRLFLKWYYSFMELAERRYLRAINHSNYLLVAVSSGTAIELHSHGISADRITYISVGVDTERFRPTTGKPQLRSELGVPQDALVFLYVGRLSVPKNLFQLVDAFGQVGRRVKHSILLMVGTGELSTSLTRYVEERAITDVRFLGFVPNDELPRIYGSGDFFIMASTYEGQPVALLEAMASGLPPIVSNIPVMEQLVKESGAGIVVDFSNPVEAANQIKVYVTSSKAVHDRVVVRRYAEAELSSEVCAEKYLELLGNLSRHSG